jgi:hypothetical protein
MLSPIIGKEIKDAVSPCDDEEQKESVKKASRAPIPSPLTGGLSARTVPGALIGFSKAASQLPASLSPQLADSTQPATSLRLTFSAVPAIRMLMPDELEQVASDMLKNISKVERIDLNSMPVGSAREDHIDPSDQCTPKRTYQERWNDRIVDALSILADEPEIRPEENKMAMAYFLGDLPVGLITLSRNSEYGDAINEIIPQVDEFVTHPLTQQCGEILLARVVQMSVLMGGKGRCILFPLQNARSAYRAMGFKDVVHEKFASMMLLDPADSDGKWVQVDEKWAFHKNPNAKYVTGLPNRDDTV